MLHQRKNIGQSPCRPIWTQHHKILLVACFLFANDYIKYVEAKSVQYIQSSESPREIINAIPSDASKEKCIDSTKCETYGCVQAAAQIISYIDESIDPCDNFYRFASGNYLKNTLIPEDKESTDLYSTVSDSVQQQLRTILSENLQSNEPKPFRLAKHFNSACLNQTIIEERGVEPLIDILNELGGWPVIEGELWTDDGWDWIEVIKKFRNIGIDTGVIFSLSVEPDSKNSTKRVLEIYQGSHELEREYLIRGFDDEHVTDYYDSMIDSAVVLGANITQAEEELSDVLDFEIKLADISLPREELRNESALYNSYTIKELQVAYPYLNWLDYINSMLPAGLEVTDNEIVINSMPTFFDRLEDLLSSTSKRTLANYLLWRVVFTTSEMLTYELREQQIRYWTELRWKECVQLTSKYFPIPVGLLYTRKHFNTELRQAAMNLVEDIRNAFIDILRTVPWMGKKSRDKAIKKAKAITALIGYPDEIIENNKLEEYYRDLELEPDNLLLNTLRLEVFNSDNSFKTLREPVIKTDWRTLLDLDPIDVNAFYDLYENSMQFPPTIFQSLFFSTDRPQYMNYASIGSIIGHEITHGFDDEGRQFDLDGNLADWWDQKTEKQFLKKVKCIIEQYGNYTDLKTNLTLNGIATQGENIADNGGAIAAYIAYENWIQRNGPESLLPGLKYSPKQLFWISFAQSGSSVSLESFIKDQIITDDHAPDEFRINGVVSNLEQFSYDFECPAGSKMNKEKKCKVW